MLRVPIEPRLPAVPCLHETTARHAHRLTSAWESPNSVMHTIIRPPAATALAPLAQPSAGVGGCGENPAGQAVRPICFCTPPSLIHAAHTTSDLTGALRDPPPPPCSPTRPRRCTGRRMSPAMTWRRCFSPPRAGCAPPALCLRCSGTATPSTI